MYYVLFNPLSNNKTGLKAACEVQAILGEKDVSLEDVTQFSSYSDFFTKVTAEDEIVLCGGDGTLNCFINDIVCENLKNKVYYYASGSGNDFAHDVENDTKFLEKLIPLNKYLKSLPVVTVNDQKKYFINGIGFGIDGYCCEAGDDMRAKASSEEVINYTAIAIKGLLGKFKPSNGKVTVDGVTKSYKKIWLAPTMIGKYYGGGMKVAPAQNRLNEEKKVSCVVWHGSGKLSTLIAFPSIFKGEHIKHKKMIEIMEGHEVTVEFDKPQALQIDGETVRNVTKYSVVYK
ncbi:MAG: diacylglycerol kinase family protein [Treponema sp.]|nr:diacylglycerol kinase family protein [Treponema sp.]